MVAMTDKSSQEETAAKEYEVHDFFVCESIHCANSLPHCGWSWCGAPRNHPSHTCYVAPEAPQPSTQSVDGSRNIHDELLPEGYRFTAADEERLAGQDFYSATSVLPPCEVNEADRFMAWRWYGNFYSPMNEELLKSMAWRISRERQLLAALTENASLRQQLSAEREAHEVTKKALELIVEESKYNTWEAGNHPWDVQGWLDEARRSSSPSREGL